VEEPIYLALDGLHDASHLGDQENTWASGSSDDGWIDPSQRHQFRSGRSQRFNQPRTTATRAPGSSTASTLRPQAPCFEPQDGSLDASAPRNKKTHGDCSPLLNGRPGPPNKATGVFTMLFALAFEKGQLAI
jgi:hypothetical protein